MACTHAVSALFRFIVASSLRIPGRATAAKVASWRLLQLVPSLRVWLLLVALVNICLSRLVFYIYIFIFRCGIFFSLECSPVVDTEFFFPCDWPQDPYSSWIRRISCQCAEINRLITHHSMLRLCYSMKRYFLSEARKGGRGGTLFFLRGEFQACNRKFVDRGGACPDHHVGYRVSAMIFNAENVRSHCHTSEFFFNVFFISPRRRCSTWYPRTHGVMLWKLCIVCVLYGSFIRHFEIENKKSGACVCFGCWMKHYGMRLTFYLFIFYSLSSDRWIKIKNV